MAQAHAPEGTPAQAAVPPARPRDFAKLTTPARLTPFLRRGAHVAPAVRLRFSHLSSQHLLLNAVYPGTEAVPCRHQSHAAADEAGTYAQHPMQPLTIFICALPQTDAAGAAAAEAPAAPRRRAVRRALRAGKVVCAVLALLAALAVVGAVLLWPHGALDMMAQQRAPSGGHAPVRAHSAPGSQADYARFFGGFLKDLLACKWW